MGSTVKLKATATYLGHSFFFYFVNPFSANYVHYN